MTTRAARWLALAGMAMLTLLAVARHPKRLVINRSASIPKGLYWNTPGAPVEIGSIALFPIPQHVRDLVYQRNMVPRSEFFDSLSKPVIALRGDHVCIRDHSLWINERRFAEVPATDSLGRELPRLEFCRQLAAGEVFVATPALSFDSRYFGPIQLDVIRGTIQPLLTW